jgi:hypothetical protein
MTRERKTKFTEGGAAVMRASQQQPIQSECFSRELRWRAAEPASPREIGGVSASWDGPKQDNAKMRLLFLGVCPPIPARNGQRMRNRNLLRALKREGIDVFPALRDAVRQVIAVSAGIRQ